MDRGTEDVLTRSKLYGAAAFVVNFIDQGLQSARVVPHLWSYKVLSSFVNGCVYLPNEQNQAKEDKFSSQLFNFCGFFAANLHLLDDIRKGNCKKNDL